MSKQDGKCNFCRLHAANPIKFIYSDVIVCSDECDEAMSWMLDGVPLEEVHANWEKRTGRRLEENL